MYTEKDYQENREQLKTRLIASIVPASIGLILSLVSFLLRWPEAVTMILSIISIGGFLFVYTMFISPVIAYGKHVDHALRGRTRSIEGTFVSMESEAVGRDGVNFYPMTLNVGNLDDEEDDRLFYYDANLPRPDWKAGDKLEITSYDNRVTKWTKF